MCDIASSQLDIPLSEGPHISVDKDDDVDDLVSAAPAFYKDSKFVKNAPVRIINPALILVVFISKCSQRFLTI